MKKLCLLMLLIISITSILSPSAFAHTNNSEGFSLIEVKENNIDYELKLDLTELGHSLNKETDKQELFDKKIVQEYINSHIKLYADSVKVEGTIVKSDVEMINDRQFAVINLNYKLEHKPEKLVLDYNIFMDDSDPSHANYATIKLDGEQQETVLSYRIKGTCNWRSYLYAISDAVSIAWLRAYLYWV